MIKAYFPDGLLVWRYKINKVAGDFSLLLVLIKSQAKGCKQYIVSLYHMWFLLLQRYINLTVVKTSQLDTTAQSQCPKKRGKIRHKNLVKSCQSDIQQMTDWGR
jgi:hypothetical protein